MSEEKKVNAAPKRMWPVVLSILAIIVIIICCAFLHWHESPSFCNVVCHQPMDRYVEGYYSEDPDLGASQHAEADVTCLGCHWSQAKMLDLVHEVTLWVSDGFTDPLEDKTEIASTEFCGACHNGTDAADPAEVTKDWALDPHNIPSNAMHDAAEIECSSCHKIHKSSVYVCAECHTDAAIPEGWAAPGANEAQAAASEAIAADPSANVTANHGTFASKSFHTCDVCHDGSFAPENPMPHEPFEGMECVDCHDGDKMVAVDFDSIHTANEVACATCHTGELPEACASCHGDSGWVIPDVTFDPHNAPATNGKGEEIAAHQGITCAQCHDGNVMYCGTCHANLAGTAAVPEGWTMPEHSMDAIAAMQPVEEETEDAEEASADEAAPAATGELKDGTYTGTGTGIGGKFDVTVTVEGGKVTAVEVGENSETQGIGSKAIEELPAKIVEANGVDGVDGVSGATVTSKAIFKAVTAALEEAQA